MKHQNTVVSSTDAEPVRLQPSSRRQLVEYRISTRDTALMGMSRPYYSARIQALFYLRASGIVAS